MATDPAGTSRSPVSFKARADTVFSDVRSTPPVISFDESQGMSPFCQKSARLIDGVMPPRHSAKSEMRRSRHPSGIGISQFCDACSCKPFKESLFAGDACRARFNVCGECGVEVEFLAGCLL